MALGDMVMYQIQVLADNEWHGGEWRSDFNYLLGVTRERTGLKDKTWRIIRNDNVVIAQSKAPVATPDPDDTEPMTAQDAMLATEDVLARDWDSDADEQAFAALSAPVVAENATADPQPEFYREDNIWQRENTKFNNTHVFKFADINGNAIKSAQKPRRRDLRGSQGKTPMNMQKGGKKSDTRALTPMSRRGKPLTPAIPMKAWRKRHRAMQLAQLGILLGDTDNIVSIVSHIETPLTGATRRIA